MSEDFGSDFITIVDDDGTEFELELLDTMDYKGQTFVAFLPADMDENDPDYGLVILRSVIDENGDELFESIDDEDELQDVYEHFAVLLFDDEDALIRVDMSEFSEKYAARNMIYCPRRYREK